MKALLKTNKKKFENGLTLIEAAMVLALSAVVIAGAVMYYNTASESNKIQRAQGLLGAIQAGVSSVYATRPTYTSLTSATLTSATAVPRSFISGTGTNTRIVNPWGGTVHIEPSTGGREYSVTFPAVPKGACGIIAAADLGNSVIAVNILDDSSDTAGAKGSLVPGASDYETGVDTACQRGDAATVKKIVWTFK
ncbi:TPA: type 4 pilus major pilin [Enterobacter asburiae]